jgi:hypothetical protein
MTGPESLSNVKPETIIAAALKAAGLRR